MKKGAKEWEQLQIALTIHKATCTDNDIYISDWFPAETALTYCKQCPVYIPCRNYARKAKPTGGIWAGRRYDTNGKQISHES